MTSSRSYRLAVLLLKRGDPLPVDLQTTLIEEGYDVSLLEAKYSL